MISSAQANGRIDALWEDSGKRGRKSPYNRHGAHKKHINFIKKKKKSKATIQAALNAQLKPLRRKGYESFAEHQSWDNFNECNTLQQSVLNYYNRFGCYPEVVLAMQLRVSTVSRNEGMVWI